MFYGQPHIDTKISLFIVIGRFFVISVIMSIIIITVFRKWKEISFSDIIKSNSILYGIFFSLCLISFFLNFYILSFSRRNDFVEKSVFILLFLILFAFQAYLYLSFWRKKNSGRFFKKYKLLTLLFYFFSMGYIIVSYFPSDAADKYLLFSTKYFFQPDIKDVSLLDNSQLRIDSAITIIDSFSNRKSYRKEILFTVYFNSQRKERVPFSFEVLDSLNATGGSSSQIKYKDLYLKKLKDSIKIVVEQVGDNIGWDNPKKTDTVEFVKIKVQKIYQSDL
jgi:hypothetical protein